MLERKGIFIELNGTWITVYQLKERRFLGIFKEKPERINQRTYGLGNSMSEVGIKVINQIRKDFSLTQKDGFDNNLFYNDSEFIDQEMITYKRIIYKLSQT